MAVLVLIQSPQVVEHVSYYGAISQRLGPRFGGQALFLPNAIVDDLRMLARLSNGTAEISYVFHVADLVFRVGVARLPFNLKLKLDPVLLESAHRNLRAKSALFAARLVMQKGSDDVQQRRGAEWPIVVKDLYAKIRTELLTLSPLTNATMNAAETVLDPFPTIAFHALDIWSLSNLSGLRAEGCISMNKCK